MYNHTYTRTLFTLSSVSMYVLSLLRIFLMSWVFLLNLIFMYSPYSVLLLQLIFVVGIIVCLLFDHFFFFLFSILFSLLALIVSFLWLKILRDLFRFLCIFHPKVCLMFISRDLEGIIVLLTMWCCQFSNNIHANQQYIYRPYLRTLSLFALNINIFDNIRRYWLLKDF